MIYKLKNTNKMIFVSLKKILKYFRLKLRVHDLEICLKNEIFSEY